MQKHSDVSATGEHIQSIAPTRAACDPAGLQYVLIMPVWGDHHTELFLEYCIPFLLTEGNIGSFPDRRLQVHIASRRTDFVRMREHPSYARLRELTSINEVE